MDADFDNEKSDNDKSENINAGDYNKTVPETPPSFVKPDEMHSSIVKPAGNMFRLLCKAIGNPLPNVTWLKNNEEPKVVRRISITKWALRVDESIVADGGNYTCIVCNHLGCIDHTFKVDVIGN